jgi:hypothetical protein
MNLSRVVHMTDADTCRNHSFNFTLKLGHGEINATNFFEILIKQNIFL